MGGVVDRNGQRVFFNNLRSNGPAGPAEAAEDEVAEDGKDPAAPAVDGDKKEGEEKKAPEEKK